MTQLAYIAQGRSDYEPRLRALLEQSRIDPHEFVGLDWFSLTPFFVLAGATVGPDAHTHGTDLHVVGVRVTIDEELEEAFYATLPLILEDAYADDPDEDETA